MNKKIIYLVKFAKIAFGQFGSNNCSYMAAAIAYWMLLSIFPLILAAMSLIGFLYPDQEAQNDIIKAILALVPVSGDYLSSLVEGVVGSKELLGFVGGIGLFLSGAKVFAAIRRGINHVWQIRQLHGFILARAIDFVMLIGTGLIIIFALLLSTGFEKAALMGGQSDGFIGLLIMLIRETLLFTCTLGILYLLYKFIPNTNVNPKEALIGAIFGTMLLLFVRVGFIWFVSTIDSFNIIYGSLGALIAVLAWSYFSSMALMWGAQISSTYKQVRLEQN